VSVSSLIDAWVALSEGVPGLVGLGGILTITTKTLTRKDDLLRRLLLYRTSELYYSHAPAMERSSASFWRDIIKPYLLDAAGYRAAHYISHYSGLQRRRFTVTCPEYRSRQSRKNPFIAVFPPSHVPSTLSFFSPQSRNRPCPSRVRYSQRQRLRE
jgi:hypothetical protein